MLPPSDCSYFVAFPNGCRRITQYYLETHHNLPLPEPHSVNIRRHLSISALDVYINLWFTQIHELT